MRIWTIAAVLAATLGTAHAQSALFPLTPEQQYRRDNDPSQWTFQDMARHTTHVTMPDGKTMSCLSTPNPVTGSTSVDCH